MAGAEAKAAEGAAEKAAPKAKKAAKQGDMVACKNISKRIINVKGASLKPGEKGKCTVAQLRQFNKFLEKA